MSNVYRDNERALDWYHRQWEQCDDDEPECDPYDNEEAIDEYQRHEHDYRRY